ncbi:MAG: hypothetical protein WD894_17865 [Pirellulales bacterium]
MFERESGDESPHSKTVDQALHSGDLRLKFDWRGDRFGHLIEQHIAGEWQVVLESLEGLPDEDWPPSPVLQGLHIEHRSTGAVALLVGKAGQNHWSASIEPLSNQGGFQFDIACRVQQPPQRLGNEYRSADCPAKPTIRVTALSPATICEWVVHDQIKVWHIRRVEVTSEYPSTMRWQYTIAHETVSRDSNEPRC